LNISSILARHVLLYRVLIVIVLINNRKIGAISCDIQDYIYCIEPHLEKDWIYFKGLVRIFPGINDEFVWS
jgi:hypothetical protein